MLSHDGIYAENIKQWKAVLDEDLALRALFPQSVPQASKQPSSLAKAITSSIEFFAHQKMTNETRPWHFPFCFVSLGWSSKSAVQAIHTNPWILCMIIPKHSAFSSKEPNVLMETTQLAQNHNSTTKWTKTDHKLNWWEECSSQKIILLWFFIPDPYCKLMKYLQNPFGKLKYPLPVKLKTRDNTESLSLWPSIAMQMASPFCTGTKNTSSLSPTVDLPPRYFSPLRPPRVFRC